MLASILFSLLFIAGLNKINIIRLFGLGDISTGGFNMEISIPIKKNKVLDWS